MIDGVTGWVLVGLAAFFVGLGKSGFSGIGLIPVSILAEMFGKQSVGVLLPMLIVAVVSANVPEVWWVGAGLAVVASGVIGGCGGLFFVGLVAGGVGETGDWGVDFGDGGVAVVAKVYA